MYFVVPNGVQKSMRWGRALRAIILFPSTGFPPSQAAVAEKCATKLTTLKVVMSETQKSSKGTSF
jgi:hypothetical protein